MALAPPAVVRIRAPVPHHIFVNFLLQVDPDRSVRTDDFVRANSGVGWGVSVWIGNPHVRRVVTYVMGGSFNRRCDKPPEKCLLICGLLGPQPTGGQKNQEGD
jgi:hypothetical protein